MRQAHAGCAAPPAKTPATLLRAWAPLDDPASLLRAYWAPLLRGF